MGMALLPARDPTEGLLAYDLGGQVVIRRELDAVGAMDLVVGEDAVLEDEPPEAPPPPVVDPLVEDAGDAVPDDVIEPKVAAEAGLASGGAARGGRLGRREDEKAASAWAPVVAGGGAKGQRGPSASVVVVVVVMVVPFTNGGRRRRGRSHGAIGERKKTEARGSVKEEAEEEVRWRESNRRRDDRSKKNSPPKKYERPKTTQFMHSHPRRYPSVTRGCLPKRRSNAVGDFYEITYRFAFEFKRLPSHRSQWLSYSPRGSHLLVRTGEFPSPKPPPHRSEGEADAGGCRFDVARITMSRLTRRPRMTQACTDMESPCASLGSPLSYEKVYPHASGLGVVVHDVINLFA
ncbi:hypothetical protein GW17_00015683 [Ensete ventricosum]|nr:hypothetical protein GW17_00015683 [Ensete ventricosum]